MRLGDLARQLLLRPPDTVLRLRVIPPPPLPPPVVRRWEDNFGVATGV